MLSGCNNNVQDNAPITQTRGTWHDHIYVNEFMGFQFELPETWFVYTEEERTAFIHSIADIAYGSYNGVLPPDIAINMQDMRAEEFLTGNSVSVDTRILSSARIPMSENEYLHEIAIFLPYLGEGVEHRNIQIGAYPKQLGYASWYYIMYEVTDVLGRVGTQVRLVNIQNEIIRSVVITTSDNNVQAIHDIWASFSAIDPQFHNAEGIIPTICNAPSTVSLGSWDNYIYTNHSLNLRFVRPYNFHLYNNNDLAASMNVPVVLLYEDFINTDLWTNVIKNENTVDVMTTFGMLDSYFIAVQLRVRSMPREIRRFPLFEYLQYLMELEVFVRSDRGFDLIELVSPTKKEFAGHEWYSSSYVMTPPDLTRGDFRVDVLVTIVDNHIWVLRIESDNEDEPHEVFAMFSQYY